VYTIVVRWWMVLYGHASMFSLYSLFWYLFIYT